MSLAGCLTGESAQDVVRLEVLERQDRNLKRLQHLFDAVHLGPHLIGHGVASRLVLLELFVAKGIALVKCYRYPVGPVVAQNAEQLTKEAEHGRGWFPARGYQGCFHTEKRTKCLGMTINEQIGRHCLSPF